MISPVSSKPTYHIKAYIYLGKKETNMFWEIPLQVSIYFTYVQVWPIKVPEFRLNVWHASVIPFPLWKKIFSLKQVSCFGHTFEQIMSLIDNNLKIKSGNEIVPEKTGKHNFATDLKIIVCWTWRMYNQNISRDKYYAIPLSEKNVLRQCPKNTMSQTEIPVTPNSHCLVPEAFVPWEHHGKSCTL